MKRTMSSPQATRGRRTQGAAAEAGLALITVLSVIFAISALALLVMYVTGKEIITSRGQRTSTDALFLADGGATVGREATYQLAQALQNAQTVAGGRPQLTTALQQMYNGGTQASTQIPLKIFNYAGFTSSTNTCCNTITNNSWNTSGANQTAGAGYEVVSQVANYPTMYVALYSADQFQALGDGTFTTKITITPRTGASGLYVDQSGPASAPTYTFHFTYTALSRGVSLQATRQVRVSKNFDVNITPGSFADFAFFSSFFGPPPNGSCTNNGYFDGSYTFDGPVFTNGKMWLAYNPTFNSSVGSANYNFTLQNGQCVPTTQASTGNVHFFDNGSPRDIADWCSPSHVGANPCSNDNPTYAQGGAAFNRLASLIPMPPNAYSQMRASIGGNPNTTTTVTNQELNQDLGLCSSSCSSNPPPNSVYLPAAGSGSVKTLTGGVYIQDNNLTGMSFSINGSGNQVTTITQTSPSPGVSSQVVTITVSQGSNQTTVSTVKNLTSGGQSSSSTTYAGQPNGVIYTSGSIGALGGRTQSATSSCPSDNTDLGQNSYNTSLVGSCIQSNTALDVVAGGTININENIRYQTLPPSSGTQPGNILGVYSATGDIMVTNAPTNLTTDAFLMSGQGQIGVTNYDTVAPGMWYNLGGQISYYAGYTGTFYSDGTLASGYGQSIQFDKRPLNGQAVPPYFPVALQYTATFNNLFDGAGNSSSWQEVF